VGDVAVDDVAADLAGGARRKLSDICIEPRALHDEDER
jgi:hypothetical protein